MKMNWHIIDSGLLSAKEAMAKDSLLLAQLTTEQDPIIHLYEWKNNCLTYGYFISPELYLHMDELSLFQLEMARRPTGGGIIFHKTDFAFSLFIPAAHPLYSKNTLENYAKINQYIVSVIQLWLKKNEGLILLTRKDIKMKEKYSFCMATPTPYDILLQGKKIAGAAQRCTNRGFLHQGSLSLYAPDFSIIRKVLKNSSAIITAMQEKSSYLFSASSFSTEEILDLRTHWKKFFLEEFINKIVAI